MHTGSDRSNRRKQTGHTDRYEYGDMSYVSHIVMVLFIGVGIAMITGGLIGGAYYNMIIGWSLYYLYASFQYVLPWENCDQSHNTKCKCKRIGRFCFAISIYYSYKLTGMLQYN